ncbi:hypothetical protein ANCCAN_13134 [Ancylostoma caninum]|uniref:NR LBD domain-containing protein n=1 Tax=Ancylostoma caninum TaxID=29170 RepID=A0A368GDS4_ANCCA|nr:hypothetical protein ANCCAN_13134 [Ancylostoma caninum]
MIISYLARIVLLLPDLSASDNDRLVNIAQSHSRKEHANQVDLNSRINPSSQLLDAASTLHRAPTEAASPNNHAVSNTRHEDRSHSRPSSQEQFLDSKCIPINDTLRKHLLQLLLLLFIEVALDNDLDSDDFFIMLAFHYFL